MRYSNSQTLFPALHGLLLTRFWANVLHWEQLAVLQKPVYFRPNCSNSPRKQKSGSPVYFLFLKSHSSSHSVSSSLFLRHNKKNAKSGSKSEFVVVSEKVYHHHFPSFIPLRNRTNWSLFRPLLWPIPPRKNPHKLLNWAVSQAKSVWDFQTIRAKVLKKELPFFSELWNPELSTLWELVRILHVISLPNKKKTKLFILNFDGFRWDNALL